MQISVICGDKRKVNNGHLPLFTFLLQNAKVHFLSSDFASNLYGQPEPRWHDASENARAINKTTGITSWRRIEFFIFKRNFWTILIRNLIKVRVIVTAKLRDLLHKCCSEFGFQNGISL